MSLSSAICFPPTLFWTEHDPQLWLQAMVKPSGEGFFLHGARIALLDSTPPGGVPKGLCCLAGSESAGDVHRGNMWHLVIVHGKFHASVWVWARAHAYGLMDALVWLFHNRYTIERPKHCNVHFTCFHHPSRYFLEPRPVKLLWNLLIIQSTCLLARSLQCLNRLKHLPTPLPNLYFAILLPNSSQKALASSWHHEVCELQWGF